MPKRALVLGGGSAIGCYLAGAYEALHDAGQEPDWIAGTSIGAVSAALIAGNSAEQRIARLREYWAKVTAPNWLPWERGAQWTAALQSRLLGRPAMFHPRLPRLSGTPALVGIYNRDPMRRLLEDLIDFKRLNAGEIRFSAVAVDLETGAEVVFDTANTEITVDHLMASSAMIPDFSPVRVGERWLVDGGMAANVPIDVVLSPLPTEDMACFVVDLFPIAAMVPHDFGTMMMRQMDLMFACQTERSLRALTAIDSERPPDRPCVDVIRTSYAADRAETAMKSWDFSEAALSQRWRCGRDDMAAAFARFDALPVGRPGLTVHPITRAGA